MKFELSSSGPEINGKMIYLPTSLDETLIIDNYFMILYMKYNVTISCYNEKAELLWELDKIEENSDDSFLSFEYDESNLIIITKNNNKCKIDYKTGKIIEYIKVVEKNKNFWSKLFKM